MTEPLLDRWETWLRGHRFATGGTVVAVALALFGGTLANGFVYDDVLQVVQNPFVRNPDLWKRIFTGSMWSFVGLGGDYYRPLQELTWWLIYRLGGENYVLFHFAQLLIFAAAAWTVHRLGIELLESDLAAFIGALLWALHPVHVEAVAYVAALGDAGAGLFYVLGFWIFVVAQKRKRGGWRLHFLAALCFFAALLFKEMALSFPLVLLAYYFFFPTQESRIKRAIQFIPYVLGLGAYLLIRHAAVGRLTLAVKPWAISGKVIWAAVALFGRNTQLFFWPAHLSVMRTFQLGPSLRSPWPWATILVVIAALWYRKSQPKAGFLVWWWPLALAPCLDYRQLSWPLVADRFSFLPSVGLCLLMAYLAVVWLPGHFNSSYVPRYVLPALGVVGMLWAAQTLRTIPNWRNNETLVASSARQAPDSPLVHMNKAWDLEYRKNDLDGAAREFRTAIKLNESSFQPIPTLRYNAYIGLGNIVGSQGHSQKAMSYFLQAIAMWPQMTFAYHSLGSLYFSRGDYSQAEEYFRKAVGYDPQDLIGRFYLGTCLMKQGKYREAAEQFKAARVVDPSYLEAYGAEARALDAAGDKAAAERVRTLVPHSR
jgi:protein O-mannosyl-transferase